MEALEFQVAGRYQSIQYLGCSGWSVYLSPCHNLSVHCFLGKYSVNTLYLFHHMSAKHHSFQNYEEFPQCSPYGGFLDGGSGPKIIWPKHNCSTRKISNKSDPHRDPGSVQQPHPENQVTDIKNEHEPWCTM